MNTSLPNNTVNNVNSNEHSNDDGNLNPDVPEFVPDFLGKANETNVPNPKNSEATRLQQNERDRLQSSNQNSDKNAHHANNIDDNSGQSNAVINEESDLWREVKRRSRTSSKESSKPSSVANTTNHSQLSSTPDQSNVQQHQQQHQVKARIFKCRK